MNSSGIPVVDLFAGPGGLGEGFSAVNKQRFQIVVSAEKDPFAIRTLRLRAYYRLLLRHCPKQIKIYFDYCSGASDAPWNRDTEKYWVAAGNEARAIELGTSKGNLALDELLNSRKLNQSPWVLIGGPPCQAYSLVGRSRNKGNKEYLAEKDNRHFLYKEYLRILQQHRPAVFVMENVKGILSAKIDGKRIFHSILKDLSDPDLAIGRSRGRCGYRIRSLVCDTEFVPGNNPEDIAAADFVIKSEEYGIPQARHRVILLGIREDWNAPVNTLLTQSKSRITVRQTIGDTPPVRSQLSKEKDSAITWSNKVREHIDFLLSGTSDLALKKILKDARGKVANDAEFGANRYKPMAQPAKSLSKQPDDLRSWLKDRSPDTWLNHEARSHMSEDLRRYVFAAAFGNAHGHSPKGHKDFSIKGLEPNHKNWKSGNFSDRFRVQLADRPSTTITSHISKDGHYFIHYDPSQCRSLTVREAARLQTFPDNYFFEGGRTEQFHQVGNAVPPLLANKIAEIVLRIISSGRESDKARRLTNGKTAISNE